VRHSFLTPFRGFDGGGRRAAGSDGVDREVHDRVHARRGRIGLIPAGEAASPAQNDPAASEAVHYFPVAGFYRTTSGVLIWVPAPGYYTSQGAE
jgi:hypothetical protein